MGQLPQVFDGDRTKAKAFMEEVKGYIRLNTNINGLNSPMKRVSFVLTLVKGDDVRSWVEDMGRVIDRLNSLVDNISVKNSQHNSWTPQNKKLQGQNCRNSEWNLGKSINISQSSKN
jgi:hypothetical protein